MGMPEANKEEVAAFIARFVACNPLDDPDLESRFVDTDYFGDSAEMADDLLALILVGKKIATCSCLWDWEHEKATLLEAGSLAAIIDGTGLPRCILLTESVVPTAYCDVDAQFAHDEGEGDLTLEYWRKVHWDFFSRTLPRIGREPTQKMPLLCEHFRVIYRED